MVNRQQYQEHKTCYSHHRSLDHFEILIFFSICFLLMSFRKDYNNHYHNPSVAPVTSQLLQFVLFFPFLCSCTPAVRSTNFTHCRIRLFCQILTKRRLVSQSDSMILLYAAETFSLTDNFKVSVTDFVTSKYLPLSPSILFYSVRFIPRGWDCEPMLNPSNE